MLPALILKAEDEMTKAVDADVAAWDREHGIRASLPHLGNLVLDYSQFNGGPQVNYPDKSFTVALNGTFFDPNNTVATQYTPATYNMTDLGGKMVSEYFTDYVLNTMLEAALNGAGAPFDITKLLNITTLSTADLERIFPGMVSHFGVTNDTRVTARPA